jgi:hypothetical protein
MTMNQPVRKLLKAFFQFRILIHYRRARTTQSGTTGCGSGTNIKEDNPRGDDDKRGLAASLKFVEFTRRTL